MEAAFFDLDKTIIARASMAAFGHHFYRGGLISRPTVVRALDVAARSTSISAPASRSWPRSGSRC